MSAGPVLAAKGNANLASGWTLVAAARLIHAGFEVPADETGAARVSAHHTAHGGGPWSANCASNTDAAIHQGAYGSVHSA
jgi:hypothetical protein